MAAMVQSFPSQTATLTMLQTRSSPTDAFQSTSPGQQHSRSNQIPRNIFNTPIGGMGAGNYRGHTATSPITPYGLASTSILANSQNPLRQHPTAPRLENRTASAPSVPFSLQIQQQNAGSSRPRPPPNGTTTPIGASSLCVNQPQASQNDPSASPLSSWPSNLRPQPTLDLNSSTLQASYATVAKSSPDRYRRTNHRRSETSGGLVNTGTIQGGSAMPSGSGMAAVGHLYQHPAQSNSSPSLTTYSSYRGTQAPSSIASDPTQSRLTTRDDSNLQRAREKESALAKRYRRRSISSLEAKEYAILNTDPQQAAQPKTYAAMLAGPAPIPQQQRPVQNTQTAERPISAHGRNGSSESSVSDQSGSKPPSTKAASAKRFVLSSPATTAQEATPVAKNEAKVINIPARGSSEASKRLATPSPLSKPMAMSPDSNDGKDSFAAREQQRPGTMTMAQSPPSPGCIPESPAAQRLAALNKKEGKKEGKSSRLRRAFSFGSAAELRKVSTENTANQASHERARLRKERYADEQEAQQAAEIQQQEAAGLGESIYSSQGKFFTGSTDNLSISSTASSASIMIRKMGKGMKKGSRSLVGLFRPKSVVGVAPADGPVEPSLAQVSMVTVEAEREKVNVNANPHDQVGGGTGFPKLERNSIDTGTIVPELAPAFSEYEAPRGRRSIVGGEDERAKVLAAVKKGILKRSGTDSGNSSPIARPVDTRTPDFSLPQVPRFSNDSPQSSSPSTPIDEHGSKRGHQRTDSVNIEGEDYFLSTLHFASGESQSVPGTPKSTAAIAARNISFNPRIQFHDTWPPAEYDRRGEIATCNRLTPMLAQQIKEELNTFKMEMEVHELSKVHTHFF